MYSSRRSASYCCVTNCSNNSATSIDPRTQKLVRFHRFPNPDKDRGRCSRWIINLRRTDLNFNNVKFKKVCSVHFEPSAYNCPTELSTSYLLPSAAPTLVDCPKPPKPTASTRTPPKKRRILSSEPTASTRPPPKKRRILSSEPTASTRPPPKKRRILSSEPTASTRPPPKKRRILSSEPPICSEGPESRCPDEHITVGESLCNDGPKRVFTSSEEKTQLLEKELAKAKRAIMCYRLKNNLLQRKIKRMELANKKYRKSIAKVSFCHRFLLLCTSCHKHMSQSH